MSIILKQTLLYNYSILLINISKSIRDTTNKKNSASIQCGINQNSPDFKDKKMIWGKQEAQHEKRCQRAP